MSSDFIVLFEYVVGLIGYPSGKCLDSKCFTVSSPRLVIVPSSLTSVPNEILFPVSIIFPKLFISCILSIPCCSFLHEATLAFSQAATYNLCYFLYLLMFASVGVLSCFCYNLLTVFLCFLSLVLHHGLFLSTTTSVDVLKFFLTVLILYSVRQCSVIV